MSNNETANLSYRKKQTFAPVSSYSNIIDIVKPTRGTAIEVVVAWHERVLHTYHFDQGKSYTYGSNPDCDVLLPPAPGLYGKRTFLKFGPQSNVIVHPQINSYLFADNHKNNGEKLLVQTEQMIPLNQGEMVVMHLEYNLKLIVRLAIPQAKPKVIPLLDLESNGTLSVILAMLIASMTSLYMAMKSALKEEIDLDTKDLNGIIYINNPIQIKPPPVVKVTPKPAKAKPAKITLPKTKPIAKATNPKPTKMAGAKSPNTSAGTEGAAKSGRKGGRTKTSNSANAQANSESRVKSSGIFSTFASGGKNNQIDSTYTGQGELYGAAQNATGKAGDHGDQPGEGIGTALRETGANGNGQSNKGVSGLGQGRRGSGGFSGISLGDRDSVSIQQGSSGEEYLGSIDKEAIRKVFFDNSRAIRYCYETELNKTSNLSGKLVLDFDIGEQGRVLSQPKIDWGASTMKNKSVAQCVLTRLKSWTFPEPPQRQVVRVLYPIEFMGDK